MIRFIAWKMHRRGLLWFGLGGFTAAFLYGLAFLSAAGKTAASQAEFGRVTLAAAKQFAFIIPMPTHPETLGGYEQYKWLAGAIVMMMVWAALVGVGAARGDEDRGLTEEWLASGISRTRLLFSRTAAFALVSLLACLGATLGISAVAPLVQQDANLAGELAKSLSMFSGVMVAYGLALLVSQLPAERGTGTALSVGLVVLLLIVNGFADTVPSLAGIGVISPFHWLEKTSTGAPGGTVDVGAIVGLFIVAIVLIGASVPIFQRRDLGSGVFAWARRAGRVVRTASRSVWLRAPFSEGLREQRVGLVMWFAGMLLLGAMMTSLTRSMGDAFAADKNLMSLFHSMAGGSIYEALLGLVFFGFGLLILAGYAVVQVSRWSAQDQEGRVEMLLSAPVSRSRVVIDRALEFALASLVLVIGGYIGVASKLPTSGLGIDSARIATATLMMWPFVLAFGGLGVALAGRWPRIAVPFLATFAVVEWIVGDMAPLFKLPDWVANLSVFHLYGNPLVGNLSPTPVVWMMLVFVLGFGIALILMRRRDVVSTA